MTFTDFLLALLVPILWGSSSLAMKYGLSFLPPFTLLSLRFGLASLPLFFWFKGKRIPVAWKYVVSYGLLLSLGQFGSFVFSLKLGIPVSIATIIFQVQVLFSIALGFLIFGEKITTIQTLGTLVALTGILVTLVDSHMNISSNSGAHAAVMLGFLFCFIATFSIALIGVLLRKIGPVNGVHLSCWGAFIGFFPVFILALVLNGPHNLIHLVASAPWSAWAAVFYSAFVATLIGYALWSRLASRYRVGHISVFLLLMPVVGIIGGRLFFGEPITVSKIISVVLVITGVFIVQFWKQIARLF